MYEVAGVKSAPGGTCNDNMIMMIIMIMVIGENDDNSGKDDHNYYLYFHHHYHLDCMRMRWLGSKVTPGTCLPCHFQSKKELICVEVDLLC